MGSIVSVREPYEYSHSADADDPNGRNSVLQIWKIRRRSISTDTTIIRDPVQMDYLDVPHLHRHPSKDYRFGKQLGEGSFSSVYQGFSLADESSIVAIKEISLFRLSKQHLLNLNHEMNILSQLKHESIVQLKSVYSFADRRFLIMEYLRGGQLLAEICRKEYYRESDARRVMYQITSALHYIHTRQVLHRDLKPENIILADRSLASPVKLVDFGFAIVETEMSKESKQQLVGSPGYIAPEVLQERRYSTKSDLWALGVIFYILLSGLMPFSTEAKDDSRVLRGDYSFPESGFAAVSDLAKDLIRKLLVVDPQQRFSAREVLDHPWMKLPLEPAETPAAATTATPAADSENNSFDRDISGNLDSIRQHHQSSSKKKPPRFSLPGLVLEILSPKQQTNKRNKSNQKREPFLSPPSKLPDEEEPEEEEEQAEEEGEMEEKSRGDRLISPSEDLFEVNAEKKMMRLSSPIDIHDAVIA